MGESASMTPEILAALQSAVVYAGVGAVKRFLPGIWQGREQVVRIGLVAAFAAVVAVVSGLAVGQGVQQLALHALVAFGGALAGRQLVKSGERWGQGSGGQLVDLDPAREVARARGLRTQGPPLP